MNNNNLYVKCAINVLLAHRGFNKGDGFMKYFYESRDVLITIGRPLHWCIESENPRWRMWSLFPILRYEKNDKIP